MHRLYLCARKNALRMPLSGEKKKPHVIDQENCIKCGICYEGCKFDAIKIC